jgi:hypothetical protein
VSKKKPGKIYEFTRVVKIVSHEAYTVKVRANSEEEALKKARSGDEMSEKHVGPASEPDYVASGIAPGTGDLAEEAAFLDCSGIEVDGDNDD